MRYFFILGIFLWAGFSLFAHIEERIISPELPNYKCHSSCIIEIKPNRLLAVWKGAVTEGTCNIERYIWLSTFANGIWQPPRKIVQRSDTCIWNPVLCQLPDDEILLFFRIGPNPRKVVGMLMRSNDGGVSWSEPGILPAGIVGPGHSKPIFDSEGRIFCGSSIEFGEPTAKEKATACWIEISEDRGKTWKKIGPLEIPGQRFGAIEPAIISESPNNFRLFCRDRAKKIGLKGWIWTSTSSDGGVHWTPLEKTSLPNPDSGLDAIRIKEGPICIAYNHSSFERKHLSLAIFKEGIYLPVLELESERGEFPSLEQTADGKIHVTYATQLQGSHQLGIKHVIIDLKDLEEYRN